MLTTRFLPRVNAARAIGAATSEVNQNAIRVGKQSHLLAHA
ncbi:MAG: hypothetical protein QNJ51_17400 [Calothrix sp. MO_167.B12]|nr:hypothetical protein [Calothrix sp. MO_167.B12]